MATGNGDGDAGGRARAVARLTTLQRLRDDAAAKNRQAMLQTIEGMIASELRALQASPGGTATAVQRPPTDRETDPTAGD